MELIRLFAAQVVRRLRSIGRFIVWSDPRIYRAVGLARKRVPKAFSEDPDFLVLGFPRSSNTYCGHYLKTTQPPGFKVLLQLHLPPMVMEAVRHRIPHILLVRNPQECALSYAILRGTRVVDQIDYYIDYHRSLLGLRDRLFIVRFEDSTTRIRQVLEEAERRFSIRLDWSLASDEAESRTRQAVLDQSLHPDGTVNHRYYNLPSEERARIARDLESQFLEPEVAARLKTAERFYRTFLDSAAVVADSGARASSPRNAVLAG